MVTNMEEFLKSISETPPSPGDSTVASFLEHFGVRGMKWGVRKKRGGTDSAAAPTHKSEKKTSADFKRIKNARSKHPSELSNKQLKDLNERLNLEKQFKELTTKVDKKKVDAGHDKVKYILGFATTALTIHQVAKSPLTKDVGKLFAKKTPKPTQGKMFG